MPTAGCAVLLGGASHRDGNAAADTAAIGLHTRAVSGRPTDLVESRRPGAWPCRLSQQSGWRRPGLPGQRQWDGSLSEQRGRGGLSERRRGLDERGRPFGECLDQRILERTGDVVKIPVSEP